MLKLYMKIFDANQTTLFVPLETAIILFAFLCETRCKQTVELYLLLIPEAGKNAIKLNYNLVDAKIIKIEEIQPPGSFCNLPVLLVSDESCVAGICSVIRQMFKSVNINHPWLGFKQNCLYACAESSLWTRFCEIDSLTATNDILTLAQQCENPIEIPTNILRFERHLEQPVRIHNIEKCKQDSGSTADLVHKFAEGPDHSIADIILFPNFYIIYKLLPQIANSLPLTILWIEHLLEIEPIRWAVGLFTEFQVIDQFIVVPPVPSCSLYKSNSKRHKPHTKLFTKCDDVENALRLVEDIELVTISEPFGFDTCFDWDTVPIEAHPDLPSNRFLRKSQQLENLAKAVLKIARNGDRIVDFCAGSGHLGLLLAHFLPRCTIILLENKEESVRRARVRAESLALSNIYCVQSNVDYFFGDFEIGVSLHACGVATDLVLDMCVRKNAAFVCCPCCYGSLTENHMVHYPKSQKFKQTLQIRDYMVLAHAADQNFVEFQSDHDVYLGKRGSKCMDVIDSDRCLGAQELGYRVFLSKLWPLSCTPKHNLLVGVPNGFPVGL